ncbi:MAG: hypothetical protein ACLQVD_08430 [Capsulimonadaceae bacterium]
MSVSTLARKAVAYTREADRQYRRGARLAYPLDTHGRDAVNVKALTVADCAALSWFLYRRALARHESGIEQCRPGGADEDPAIAHLTDDELLVTLEAMRRCEGLGRG